MKDEAYYALAGLLPDDFLGGLQVTIPQDPLQLIGELVLCHQLLESLRGGIPRDALRVLD
jgi:hypothetical protein